MRRGELWLVKLFESTGREQYGLRPAIIIADTPTDICIVVPLTSNLKALKFPYTIQVEPTKHNGLQNISVALVFQIRAIDKSRLTKKLGQLEKSSVENIAEVLSKLLL